MRDQPDEIVRNICDTCDTPYIPTAPHYKHCVAAPITEPLGVRVHPPTEPCGYCGRRLYHVHGCKHEVPRG